MVSLHYAIAIRGEPRDERLRGRMSKMKTKQFKQYAIKATFDGKFFAAIHSYTPFYSDMAKARRFTSREMATAYARTELFTADDAFEIVELASV